MDSHTRVLFVTLLIINTVHFFDCFEHVVVFHSPNILLLGAHCQLIDINWSFFKPRGISCGELVDETTQLVNALTALHKLILVPVVTISKELVHVFGLFAVVSSLTVESQALWVI